MTLTVKLNLMHDHEFERQVHQKMEELNLSPSDAVWELVEGQLHKKKRKRRLLWLPFFFAGLILCGYFLQSDYGTGHKVAEQTNKMSGNPADRIHEPSVPGKIKKVQPAKTETPVKATNQSNQKTNVTIATDSLYKGQQLLPHARNAATGVAVSGTKATRPATSGTAQTAAFNKQKFAVHKQERNQPDRTASTDEIVTGGRDVATPLAAPTGLPDQLLKEPSAVTVSDALLAKEPFIINVMVAPYSGLASQAVKLQKKKLEWGITLRAGRTSVNNGNLNKFFASSLVNDMNALSSNGGIISIAPPSKVQAGNGFSAGMFLRKRLNRKLAVSAGINYALFTTSIVTGNRVDSAVGQFGFIRANEYYRLGNSNTYTNRYHFIELPVLLHTQLNKGNKIPLVWEAGITLSQLIANNALHYTSTVNGYSKNSSLYNRTQISLQTGMYLQAFSRSQHSVRIGPHIQYGITPLFTDANNRRNHLLQYGLTISTVIR